MPTVHVANVPSDAVSGVANVADAPVCNKAESAAAGMSTRACRHQSVGRHQLAS